MCRHFCWCMYTYIRLYLRMCMGIASHPQQPPITPPNPPNSSPQKQHLEAQGPNKDFWAALALVCKDELAKAGALPGADALTSGGVHAAVAEELEGMYVFLGW